MEPVVRVVDERKGRVDVVGQALAQRYGEPHISSRLLSANATAEQHSLLAKGQGRS